MRSNINIACWNDLFIPVKGLLQKRLTCSEEIQKLLRQVFPAARPKPASLFMIIGIALKVYAKITFYFELTPICPYK